MAEELQGLIDTLNREVLEKAEQEAALITAAAEEKANRLVQEAEKKAAQIISTAEHQAEAFTDRAIKTLGHAGRDLLIKVKAGIERLIQSLAKEAVQENLSSDVVKEMLIKMSDDYFSLAASGKPLQVAVSPDDHQSLVRFFADRYKNKLAAGLEIKLDPQVERGFRVKIGDEAAYHDFTATAIAEELAKLLKPVLADIVLRSSLEQEKQRGSSVEQRAA